MTISSSAHSFLGQNLDKLSQISLSDQHIDKRVRSSVRANDDDEELFSDNDMESTIGDIFDNEGQSNVLRQSA